MRRVSCRGLSFGLLGDLGGRGPVAKCVSIEPWKDGIAGTDGNIGNGGMSRICSCI